jgi:MYXO-CTERM domain-containing protein
VVGYGRTDDEEFGIRHTRSGLEVAKVGTSQFREEGDSIPPRTFTSEGPALCIGDSGGPAYSDQGAVIGVWSQVVGDCTASTAVNYFTEVAPFRAEIIDRAFVAAGYEPLLETSAGSGQAGAGGSAGAASVAQRAGASGAGPGSAGAAGQSPETGSSQLPSAGAAGASPQLPATPVAGAAGTVAVPYRGLRKQGGCTCRVAGATPGRPGGLLMSLLAFSLAWGRRRRRPLGRGARSRLERHVAMRQDSQGAASAPRLCSCSTFNCGSM